MPKTEHQTLKVQDVRKDDMVTHRGRLYAVTGRDVKTKFVYLTTLDDDTLRIELDTQVEVDREVPTTAERLTDAREALLWQSDNEYRNAMKRLANARIKLTDRFTNDHVASSFDVNELINAQAVAEVNAHLPSATDDATPDEKLTQLRRVIVAWTAKLLDNSLEGHSTSAISNAMDDARREAASRLVGQFSSIGGMLRYVDKLQAELDEEVRNSR